MPSRWLWQPQRVWARRALFQIHLWVGIALSLYVLLISVTGSVLVYRNELFRLSPAVLDATSWLLDLHDNLLSGTTGLRVNGFAALAVVVVALTGLVVWWPGARVWRRSLVVPRGVGFRRTMWHLHSMVGFWTFGFTTVLALSGAYFAFPDTYQAIADWIEPVSDRDGTRLTDSVIYWLAYLHFGRINGIGIPCSGPGICDQAVKATWAFFGLAPAALSVTGVVMWWTRVVRPSLRRRHTDASSVS